MSKVTHAIYGWLAAVALICSFLVALLFLLALVIGGDFGAGAAELGGKIMNGGIVVAAVAVGGGLVWMYLTGNHTLKMEKGERPETGTAGEHSAQRD